MAPIKILGLRVLTNPATPDTAKRILNCGGDSSAASGWVYVSASRARNVNYTNTSDKMMFLSVAYQTPTSFIHISIFINGQKIFYSYSGDFVGQWNAFSIIPPGSTYRLEVSAGGGANLVHCYELLM